MISSKTFKVFLVTLFINFSLASQEAEFNTLLKGLSSKLETVENAKKTFTQAFDSENAGVIKYSLTDTDKKGKIKEYVYEFNVADIDINTIKPVTSKDLIQIQLIVDKNQKMIKQVVNNEKINYLNKMFVYATNIDNAREVSDLLKKIVPICQEITKNRLALNSYEERLHWLTKNVVNVNLIDKSYAQSLTTSKTDVGNVTIINTLSKSKSSETNHYQFNLANINPNAVFFKSSGSEFLLQLETKRRLKTIKVTEDGEQKNYTNKINIQCSSVENARELQKVIQDIIPIADQKIKASLPKITSVQQGLELINKKINTITTEKLTTQQAFTTSCVTTFTKIEESTKKKDDFIYDLNLIDVNKEDVEIEIKGTSVYVVSKTTAKNKFIKLVKNDELQNYTNNFRFVCNSIEDALYAQYIMKTIIEDCTQEYKKKPKMASKSAGLKALESNIKSVQLAKLTYEQKVEKINADDTNGLRYTNVEVSDKKSEKNVQEFNLSDINSKSVKIKISGKKVMVEFATNYQEKIIKTYEDGEIKSYTNKVSIYCNTIENARKIASLVRRLTEKK